ncbi:MAG TPA: WbqC family protein [Steroidobacteraceae bacterium]|nr:WbqC family protein [Steroidobacteraceae bacterium]
MQPYFFPYIGYFQLIAAVNLFIVYDNIQYTKNGWINRNRLLRNCEAAMFSLPLKRASDYLDVRDRELAADFKPEKLLNQLKGAYGRAPQFAEVFPLIERVVRHDESNLFRFLHHSIRAICGFLRIGTEIRISSGIAIDHTLTKQNKVIALCRAAGAATYVNASGGVDLYSKEEFHAHGIELRFIRSQPFEYPQFGDCFVPLLSIIDVMMFNPVDVVRERIASGYELI